MYGQKETIESAGSNETRAPASSKSCEDYSDSDEPPPTLLSDSISEPLFSSLFPLTDIRRRKCSSNVSSSPKTTSFRKLHYPQVPRTLWNDAKWQLQNRITTVEQLSSILRLSEEEKHAFSYNKGKLPFAVTPYYASLLDRNDPLHPLRRAVVPVASELFCTEGESNDPLHEDAESPVPGLVHRYPDRVLLLVTDFCSTYCRYCTRSRMVGRSSYRFSQANLETAAAYIESHNEIRDVLVSGGDPLTLSNEALDWLLARLRRIPHVEIIRIGTKVPVVLPQRVTKSLVRVLKRYHPLWMNIHFMHPDEITAEVELACKQLANAGIPLGSQTVLLKGINDTVDVMRSLLHKLLICRVRPYYLYQCDPISGSSHFRTNVETGIGIIKGIRGFTTGLAIPYYVIDAPGGGGKIPLQPQYYQGKKGKSVILMNYNDREYVYPDTCL